MSAFPQYVVPNSSLPEQILSTFERVCAGDSLFFENFDSPFYAETGSSFVYVSRITDSSLIVQKYEGKDAQTPVRMRVEREILFADISSLDLRFPLAPDGRIYRAILKK